jgi:hypothetical protein
MKIGMNKERSHQELIMIPQKNTGMPNGNMYRIIKSKKRKEKRNTHQELQASI